MYCIGGISNNLLGNVSILLAQEQLSVFRLKPMGHKIKPQKS